MNIELLTIWDYPDCGEIRGQVERAFTLHARGVPYKTEVIVMRGPPHHPGTYIESISRHRFDGKNKEAA